MQLPTRRVPLSDALFSNPSETPAPIWVRANAPSRLKALMCGVTFNVADGKVVCTALDIQSPLAKCGLMAGDILLSVHSSCITSPISDLDMLEHTLGKVVKGVNAVRDARGEAWDAFLVVRNIQPPRTAPRREAAASKADWAEEPVHSSDPAPLSTPAKGFPGRRIVPLGCGASEPLPLVPARLVGGRRHGGWLVFGAKSGHAFGAGDPLAC